MTAFLAGVLRLDLGGGGGGGGGGRTFFFSTSFSSSIWGIDYKVTLIIRYYSKKFFMRARRSDACKLRLLTLVSQMVV